MEKKEKFTDVFKAAVGVEGTFKIAINPDFEESISIEGLISDKEQATIKRIADKVVKRALTRHERNKGAK